MQARDDRITLKNVEPIYYHNIGTPEYWVHNSALLRELKHYSFPYLGHTEMAGLITLDRTGILNRPSCHNVY